MKQLFTWLRPKRKSMLFVTTAADISSDLFFDPEAAKRIDVVLARYSDTETALRQLLGMQKFDFIYLRDPFNEGQYSLEMIEKSVRLIAEAQPQARFIDQAKTIEDLLFEDKFAQYQLLQGFMPETELLREPSQFEPGKNIIKKRISARARDIAFAYDPTYANGDYIVQLLLSIQTEYRVYSIGGEVIKKGSVKSSKQTDTKVKVIAVVDIPENVRIFANSIIKRMPQIDLVGFDIAETTEGALMLIEANRSCQFSTFTKLSGINLAKILVDKLLG